MTPLRIVVVEDDAIIATLVEELLEVMGHSVCANVATEHGAVAAASRWSPDLMIVDEQLGPGSGVCAMNKILLCGPMPHLFVSTHSLRIRAASANAIIVAKPFREQDLAVGIDLALAAVPGH